MKKAALIAVCLLAVLAAAGTAYWRLKMGPHILVEETRFGRMNWLGTGIVKYHDATSKMPRSLEEIVAAGYLPKESKNYANPMMRMTLKTPVLSYKACEFDFAFGEKSAQIFIPMQTFAAKAFAGLDKDLRVWTVSDEVHMYDPKTDR